MAAAIVAGVVPRAFRWKIGTQGEGFGIFITLSYRNNKETYSYVFQPLLPFSSEVRLESAHLTEPVFTVESDAASSPGRLSAHRSAGTMRLDPSLTITKGRRQTNYLVKCEQISSETTITSPITPERTFLVNSWQLCTPRLVQQCRRIFRFLRASRTVHNCERIGLVSNCTMNRPFPRVLLCPNTKLKGKLHNATAGPTKPINLRSGKIKLGQHVDRNTTKPANRSHPLVQ